MLIKFKPTTPGLRGTVLVSKKELSKDKPFKSLTRKFNSTGGGNNHHMLYINGSQIKKISTKEMVNKIITLIEKKELEIKNNSSIK